MKHDLTLVTMCPLSSFLVAYPRNMREIIHQELDELIANGRVEESQSLWSSPVLLLRRHESYRMCIDYHKLNLCT